MIERIEIATEALPFNGVDAGFRNPHDLDFQSACLTAIEGVLGRVFQIHYFSLGRLSARIEYLANGLAGRIVDVPWRMCVAEKNAWAAIGEKMLEQEAFDSMKRGGNEYGVVVVVFQGVEIMRIGFMLAAAASQSAQEEERFRNLVSTFGIMASNAVRLEEFRYLGRHDALTGLANRPLFLQKIAEAIRDIPCNGPGNVLFEIRLTSLGEVNDNFGFHAGDELILEAARRLSGLSCGKGFVARVGGSKLMVLLQHKGRGNINMLTREVENALEARMNVGGQEMRMNVDIGCVALDDPRMHPVEAIQRVETAVIDARGRSVLVRQKVYIYNDGFFEGRKGESHLNLLVRQAYDDNRFFILFQPIIDLQGNRICGCEALLRMRDMHGQTIEAERFMPAVERIRYQSTLDDWVFHEILRLHETDASLRRQVERSEFFLTMNCHPGTISRDACARDWLAGLRDAGMDPRRLVLEVVETPILFEDSNLQKNLAIFREEGVRIAVDDFGSGYSNLGHLANLPVDLVKIDRGFLKILTGRGSREAALITAMINLSSELGYDNVCEGVETESHASFLKSTGCRYAQGYFYGKPMPLEAIFDLAGTFNTTAEASK